MSDSSRPSYEFGPFSLDAARHLLRRNSEPVPLSPKVFETLLALLEHRERVVTKDELLTRVWGDTAVEEGGLTRNVSVLRKTLGETPDDHHYIVTVPGRGYRFVAEVRENTGNSDAVAIEALAAPAPEPDRRTRPVARWLVPGGLALLALAIVAFILRPVVRATDAGRPTITSLAVLPLANLSGDSTQEYFADGMTKPSSAILPASARFGSSHVLR